MFCSIRQLSDQQHEKKKEKKKKNMPGFSARVWREKKAASSGFCAIITDLLVEACVGTD